MAQDPLSLLRDFTVSKKPIALVNADGAVVTELTEATDVVFQDDTQSIKVPRTTTTTYRRGASDETYTLETLLFLLQRANQSVAEYSLEGATKGIPIVSILDRRSVLDYLTGVTATSANIVQQADTNKRVAEQAMDIDTESASKKPKTVSQSVYGDEAEILRAIISKERLCKTTASILRGNRSFANIQKTGIGLLLKGKPKDDKNAQKRPQDARGATNAASTHASTTSRHPPSSSSAATGSSTTTAVGNSSSNNRSRSRVPIIIIPAAITSMLTMYNIKQFLEKQEYVEGQVAKEQYGSKPKPTYLNIERRQKPNETHKTIYQVIDSTDHLRPEDWDRVVCVFTNGAEWQFKKLKWPKPIDLFANVKGFYVKWTDEQPKDIVKSWNVETINIDRTRRHTDRARVTEFWDKLQSWCLKNKPHLAS
ncbi:accessory factor associated with RNA polymerase II [Actinomortierella wolfii]|nr:accessory factor associated with RNA polymerase II [Actinomortierella wolfii]